MIPMTMYTIVLSFSPKWRKAGSSRNPSMAEVIEMGGVMIPSAKQCGSAKHGRYHQPFFLSPHQCIERKSSAFSTVVGLQYEQNILDGRLKRDSPDDTANAPIIRSSLIFLALIIALKT